jgi:hypothetical protein
VNGSKTISTSVSASLGALAITYLYLVFLGTQLRTGLGIAADLLIALGGGTLVIIIASAVAWPLSQLVLLGRRRLGPEWAITLGSAFAFISLMLAFNVPANIALPFGLGLFLGQIAIAGGIGLIVRADRRVVFGIVLFVAGLLVDILVASLLLSPGTQRGLFDIHQGLMATELADPSAPGRFAISYASYGRGDDRNRPEFASEATWLAGSVDLSPFVSLPVLTGNLRESYWGYDLTTVPLNGQVWYPDGSGPFPIVLMVHGNALMTEPSDQGYAYLGELLATRGYIAISVDQNFLNTYLGGSLRDENDARAILLLEHINQWIYWSGLPTHPLYAKIDFSNLALIGHSRGGEAAIIAAYFSMLESYPDNPKHQFSYPFRIRSVVSIAPAVPSYRPARIVMQPENFNYLLLQGSHDADSYAHWGSLRLNDLQFNDEREWIKTSLYIYRANHSQFNSEWGRLDAGPPEGWLLNTLQLLEASQQRKVAQVFISAFLDATLKHDQASMELLVDPRLGARWLPQVLLKGLFTSSSNQPLLNFEADLPQANWWVQGIAAHQVTDLAFRYGGSQENSALHLDTISTGAQFIVEIPGGYLLPERPILTLQVSDPRPFNQSLELATFSVQFYDKNGPIGRVSSRAYLTLMPPFEAQFTKWQPLERLKYGSGSEVVLQTAEIPLNDLPDLAAAQVVQIRFIFEGAPIEALIIDEIGFRSGHSHQAP